MISACYIILVVLLTALPSHFYVATLQTEIDPFWTLVWMLAGALAACLAGTIATLVPMQMGLRAFRALELLVRGSGRGSSATASTRPNGSGPVCPRRSNRDKTAANEQHKSTPAIKNGSHG